MMKGSNSVWTLLLLSCIQIRLQKQTSEVIHEIMKQMQNMEMAKFSFSIFKFTLRLKHFVEITKIFS